MKVTFEFSGEEQQDLLLRALLDAQAMFYMRVREAMTGALSPDPENASEAQRDLDMTNDLLRQFKGQIPGLRFYED